mmetsp:Transcript_37388/g.51904  ORF Transcript_37388/g.51904 Transcript_37388/m.51904 type:complete len:316 (-) Transcript_37388:221-1168(-)
MSTSADCQGSDSSSEAIFDMDWWCILSRKALACVWIVLRRPLHFWPCSVASECSINCSVAAMTAEKSSNRNRAWMAPRTPNSFAHLACAASTAWVTAWVMFLRASLHTRSRAAALSTWERAWVWADDGERVDAEGRKCICDESTRGGREEAGVAEYCSTASCTTDHTVPARVRWGRTASWMSPSRVSSAGQGSNCRRAVSEPPPPLSSALATPPSSPHSSISAASPDPSTHLTVSLMSSTRFSPYSLTTTVNLDVLSSPSARELRLSFTSASSFSSSSPSWSCGWVAASLRAMRRKSRVIIRSHSTAATSTCSSK